MKYKHKNRLAYMLGQFVDMLYVFKVKPLLFPLNDNVILQSACMKLVINNEQLTWKINNNYVQ